MSKDKLAFTAHAELAEARPGALGKAAIGPHWNPWPRKPAGIEGDIEFFRYYARNPDPGTPAAHVGWMRGLADALERRDRHAARTFSQKLDDADPGFISNVVWAYVLDGRERVARRVALRKITEDTKIEGLETYQKTAPTKAVKMDEAFEVETLEGTMKGKAGDYLAEGPDGERWPVDADIFDKTHTKVARAQEFRNSLALTPAGQLDLQTGESGLFNVLEHWKPGGAHLTLLRDDTHGRVAVVVDPGDWQPDRMMSRLRRDINFPDLSAWRVVGAFPNTPRGLDWLAATLNRPTVPLALLK